MPQQAPPSRLRLIAVTLAIVATVSAGAILPLVSATSSSFRGVSSGNDAYTVNTKEVREVLGTTPAGGSRVILGVVATIELPVNSSPSGVAADSVNGYVYVTESRSDNVSVIDESNQTVVATVVVGFNPSGVVFDSANSEIYVANFLGDDVKIINTTKNVVVANVSVAGSPVGLACDSLNGNVYVTQQHANSVSVIAGSGSDANTVIAKVGVGSDPIAAAFDNSTGDVYVANAESANVSVIYAATNTVVRSIPVGSTPLGVAYDSGNGNVYVTNELSNNTTVISGATEKVVTSLTVGDNPVGIAYNPAISEVAVVAEGAGQVNFISDATNTLVDNVTVGSLPVGIAYDPVGHYEYVANANSSNVSVIGASLMAPYAVTFSETGLVSGTNWSVTLEGISKHSTGASIAFSETNGSYTFTVGAIPGYTVSPSSGTLKVDGFPVPEPVVFTPVLYAVTFIESGLENGTVFSVTFNGILGNSTNSTLSFDVVNGTYPYTVAAVSGLSANLSSGSVVVKGAPVDIYVGFTPGPSSSSILSSGSLLWLYVVIAVVIAAVVIGVVLLLRRRRPPAVESVPSPSSPSGTPPASR